MAWFIPNLFPRVRRARSCKIARTLCLHESAYRFDVEEVRVPLVTIAAEAAAGCALCQLLHEAVDVTLRHLEPEYDRQAGTLQRFPSTGCLGDGMFRTEMPSRTDVWNKGAVLFELFCASGIHPLLVLPLIRRAE